MVSDLKDKMMVIGIGLPRRFNKREKAVFAEEVLKRFKALGYTVSLDQIKDKTATVSNLVIGDMKNAKIVFVAGYDTPSQMLLPNYRYTPFNIKKCMRLEKLNLFLQFLIVALAAAGLLIILKDFARAQLIMKIIRLICVLILGWIIVHYSHAAGNKFNLNRNSAAIVLCLALAEELKKERVAFILADQCVASFRGLAAIKEKYEGLEQKKRFIVLDCLGHGSTLVAAHGERMNEEAKRLCALAPELNIYDRSYSEEKCLQNGLAVLNRQIKLVVGDIENHEFVVKKTRSRQDIYVDYERLDKIKAMLVSYCLQDRNEASL